SLATSIPTLPRFAEHQSAASHSGLIVAMGDELPNFKIWSPNLRQKLGFLENELMSLEQIMDKKDVEQIMKNLKIESEQRKLLRQMHGNDSVLRQCLETSF